METNQNMQPKVELGKDTQAIPNNNLSVDARHGLTTFPDPTIITSNSSPDVPASFDEFEGSGSLSSTCNTFTQDGVQVSDMDDTSLENTAPYISAMEVLDDAPAAAPCAFDPTIADASPAVELVSQRTLHSKTYDLGNKYKQTVVFPYPVHFLLNEELTEIDNTFVVDTSLSQAYTAKSGETVIRCLPVQAEAQHSGLPAYFAELSHRGYSLRIGKEQLLTCSPRPVAGYAWRYPVRATGAGHAQAQQQPAV